MKKTERFGSLEEVHAQRERLRIERDVCADRLGEHWQRMKDKEFRRGLMLDAASDLLRHDSALGSLGTIAEGVKMAGGWLPIVGPLLAGRKGLFGSRLFWSGLSLALPLLVNKDGESRFGDLWDGVRNGIEHVKEFMRKHKAQEVEEE